MSRSNNNQKPENCIAFKLNYCDGGASPECIGFRGLCSDAVMNYNVNTAKRGWCSHEDNLCKQLLSKKISPEEFKEKWNRAETEEVAGTCNEGFALKLWYAEAGWSGNPQQQDRIANENLTNHLCVLTTIKPNVKDTYGNRFVFAMFKIKNLRYDDEGRVVGVNADWRLEFRPNEAEQIDFWKIYQQSEPPWRQGLFRYFDDETAIKFLKRAVEVKRGTPEENFAKEFLKQYPYK